VEINEHCYAASFASHGCVTIPWPMSAPIRSGLAHPQSLRDTNHSPAQGRIVLSVY